MTSFKCYAHIPQLQILVLLLLLFLLVANCNSPQQELTGIHHPSGEEFAGSQSCVQCHKSITQSFVETPHFLTSSVGSVKTIKGSLDSGENVLVLTERLKVFMEERQGKVFQRATIEGKDVDKKPIDISMGSGRQEQTYLYWKGDSLFQLPASYHASTGTWSNSPGYPSDRIIFDRSISARCLECHATNFKVTKSFREAETFDPTKAILGVDCERCHGPAARHVKFHRKNSGEVEGKFIINPQSLDKKLKIDNCALCHSGMRTNLMPSFSYTVGNDLDRFFVPMQSVDSGASVDVHGNQVGLLRASKCFKLSDMDCSTCHDVHAKETKKLSLFSARCMNCHEEGGDKFCKQPPIAGIVLRDNCVDCHMPSLPSRKVFLQSASRVDPTPFFVRTHLIGIYKKQIDTFISNAKK